MARPLACLILACLIQLAALAGCAERGIAPPIIESRNGPDPIAESTPGGDGVLKVATANLWGVVALGFDWSDHIDERFAAFATLLARNEPDLDVVLIQEAWKDRARHALLEDAGVVRQFPYRVDAVDSPGGAGLVILSRHPIEQAAFHRFEAQGLCLKFWEGDCLAGKGVLIAKLNVQGRSLWLATTHLIACYAGHHLPEMACDHGDPNGETRARQILEVRRFVEAIVGNEPALLGGDFNFTRTSRDYPAMTVLTNARGWSEPGDASAAPDRIDYLWTYPGSELHWQPRRRVRPIFSDPVALPSGEAVPLSDHPVLLGAFCLARADDPGQGCLSPSTR